MSKTEKVEKYIIKSITHYRKIMMVGRLVAVLVEGGGSGRRAVGCVGATVREQHRVEMGLGLPF